MASPTPSAGRRTPLRGGRRVFLADDGQEEPLEASSVSLLRKRALLRSFGKNYLADAYHPDLGLLCVPDGPDFHLYRFHADAAATHTGCVLRPASLVAASPHPGGGQHHQQHQALHAAWAPDAAAPSGLLAVAWPRSLVLYRITVVDVEGGAGEGSQERKGVVAATKLGEVKLERKPAGLAWHPACCVPLLAVHDISEVILVQLPRAAEDDGPLQHGIHPPFTPSRSSSSSSSTPLRAGTPSSKRYTPSRAASVVPPEPSSNSSSNTGGAAIKIASFSPSLPGALESLAWSQRGRHLAVCMEGVLRVYDWPAPHVANLPLEQLDVAAIPHVDTRLRRRVRALRSAAPQGFAAATDAELGLLDGRGSGVGRRSPAVGGVAAAASSSSLHLIHVAEDQAGTSASAGATRLVDIETAAVARVTMPDLLAVKPVGSGGRGEPATHALAAIGSHTAEAISVFRLTAHGVGAPAASVVPLFTITLPPATRPKGLAFVGSRLVILTGVREGTARPASAHSFGEFTVSLAVYSLPPDGFHLHHRPSTPTRYTASLETQRVYPPSSSITARYGSPAPSGAATPVRPGSRPLYPPPPHSPAPTSGYSHYAQSLRLSRTAAASPAPSLGSLTLGPRPYTRTAKQQHPGVSAALGPLGVQPRSQMGTPVRAFTGPLGREHDQQHHHHLAHHPASRSHTPAASIPWSRSETASSPFLPTVGRVTGLGKGKGAPASPVAAWAARGGCPSPGLTGRQLTDLPALNFSSNLPSLGSTPRGFGTMSPVAGAGGGGRGSSLSISGRRPHSPAAAAAAAGYSVPAYAAHAHASAAAASSSSSSSAFLFSSHQPQQPSPATQGADEQAPPTLEQLSAAVAAIAVEAEERWRRVQQVQEEEEEEEEDSTLAFAAGSHHHHHHSRTGSGPQAGSIIAGEEKADEEARAEAQEDGGHKATGREEDSPSPLLPTSISPLPYPSASPRPPSVLMMATAGLAGDKADVFAAASAWAADTTGRRTSMGGTAVATPAFGATADRLFGSATGGSRPGTSYSHLWPSQPPASSARATPLGGDGMAADDLFGSVSLDGNNNGSGSGNDADPFAGRPASSVPAPFNQGHGLSPPPPPPPPATPKAPVMFYNPAAVVPPPPPPPKQQPLQQPASVTAAPSYPYATNTNSMAPPPPPSVWP